MAKKYARLNWNNTTTYVSAENLNKMDKGIDDCDDAIEVLNEGLKNVNNNLTSRNVYLKSVGVKYDNYYYCSYMFPVELPSIPTVNVFGYGLDGLTVSNCEIVSVTTSYVYFRIKAETFAFNPAIASINFSYVCV